MRPKMAPMTVKIAVGLVFCCSSLGTCYAPKDGPHDCEDLNMLGIVCFNLGTWYAPRDGPHDIEDLNMLGVLCFSLGTCYAPMICHHKLLWLLLCFVKYKSPRFFIFPCMCVVVLCGCCLPP